MANRRGYNNELRLARSFGWVGVVPSYVTTRNLQTFNRAAKANKGQIIFNVDKIVQENNYSGVIYFSLFGVMTDINIGNMVDLRDSLRRVFGAILDTARAMRSLKPRDRIMVEIFEGEHWVGSQLVRNRDMRPRDMLRLVEAYLQSHQQMNISSVTVTVKFFKTTAGGAYLQDGLSALAFVKKKRCCVEVVTDRGVNDCFFQCVAIGKYIAQEVKMGPDMINGSGRHKRRSAEAQLLATECGWDVREPVTMDAIPALADVLQIGVLIIAHQDLSFMLQYKLNEGRVDIIILYVNEYGSEGAGHFHVVRKNRLGALWDKRRFCYKCMQGYQDSRHHCIETCIGCKRTSDKCMGGTVELATFGRSCQVCNLAFYNDACFNYHLEHRCPFERRCANCSMIVKSDKEKVFEHRCGMMRCGNCKDMVPMGHQCYIQRIEPATEEEITSVAANKYIYYDYEVMFEGVTHVVAGVVAMYASTDEVYRFASNEKFMDWVLQKKHRGYTMIAHNSGRYDAHFVKQELIRRRMKTKDIINGRVIAYIRIASLGIRVVDSYRFILTGLRKFPKTFGFDDVGKGFFPYKFFTTDRRDYVGPLPGREWFDYGKMDAGTKEEFDVWYAQTLDDGDVDLYEMCMRYCEDDVKVLKKGCSIFRDIFLSLSKGEVDPFQMITLASVCMTMYCRFFMPLDSIPVLRPVKESLAKVWMARIQKKHNGEGHIVSMDPPCVLVDGVFNVYADCVESGCTACFAKYTLHPTSFLPMRDVRREFDNRVRTLRGREIDGSVFVVTWACMVDVNDCILTAEERTECSRSEELSIRDAFYGGRTEPTKCSYKVGPRSKIHYIDMISLYPSIQSCRLNSFTTGEVNVLNYPGGAPRHLDEWEYEAWQDFTGVIKCTVNPPKDLYLPVLPERKDGKLIFDLKHKTGTWAIVEVALAVKMGYVVEHIYDVVVFDDVTPDLFTEYVRMFLKLKQESTGWKKLRRYEGDTPEAFTQWYFESQGILLDVAKVGGEANPGMRFIAKICLNSLWGKFGQRDSFPTTVEIYNQKDFEKIAHSDDNEVINVYFHDAEARTVQYRKRKEFKGLSRKTNIAIAVMTTALARVRLYEALDILKGAVLYMDTDSIIYVEHEADGDDQPRVPRGSLLGDMTSELEEGEWIVNYVSTGPKSYAFETNLGNTVCKVKGFSMKGTQNGHEMLHRLVEHKDEREFIPSLKFDIQQDHSIKTVPNFGKDLRFTFNKRELVTGVPTPDGYGGMFIDSKPFS